MGSIFMGSAQAAEVAESEFKWTGKKVTGQHYGKIPLKSSKLKEKDGKISGGEFVLDLNQMTVEDLTGKYRDKFLGHMKSPDFFEVKTWPTAKLVISELRGAEAKGLLTIKGKTNPVKINFKEDQGVYSGVLNFDRTKFDMIYGSGSFFKNLGDKMIYNEVTVEFKVKIKSR